MTTGGTVWEGEKKENEKRMKMIMKMKKEAGKEKLRLEQSLLVPVSNTDWY